MNTRIFTRIYVLLLFLAAFTYTKAQTTYYSQGSLAPNVLANWNSSPSGGGTTPADFGETPATINDVYIVQSGHTMTLPISSAWYFYANELQVAGTLIANDTILLDVVNGSYFHIVSGGTYVHNNAYNASLSPLSSFDAEQGSLVEIRGIGSQTIPGASYGNILISSSSVVNVSGSSLIPRGTLTINTGCTLDMGTNRIEAGVGFAVSNLGTLRTAYANGSSTNTTLPPGYTWGGTVEYYSTSPTAQAIVTGTYNNLNTTGGNRRLFASTTITIGNNFTPGTGTFTVSATNTFVFNAVGSQNIPPIGGYSNITISGGGTKTLTGDVTLASTSSVLTLSSSSDFLALNGNTLTLRGTTSLTGALIGSTTSNIVVDGAVGSVTDLRFSTAIATNNTLRNLTVAKTVAGGGVRLMTNLAITNLLTISQANSTLNLNNNIVTLRSTSVSNTAQLGTMVGAITYGTGSFIVERYIPNSPHNNRAYRDLGSFGINTPALPAGSVFNNWQEGGTTPYTSAPAGSGIYITGIQGPFPGGVDATTGLDITASGYKSMHTFISNTWADVANTRTLKLNPYQGYRVLVRGDRTFTMYTATDPLTMNAATTMRVQGQAITGTLTYTTSGVSGGVTSSYGLSSNATGYAFLANPYAAILDWNALTKSNVDDRYWYLEPTIGNTGVYVTWDQSLGTNSDPSNSSVNQYIQPGQAFFVRNIGVSPSLTIAETNKAVTGGFTGIFRQNNTTPNRLSYNIAKVVSGDWRNMDGCVTVFATGLSNDADSRDASKITNTEENIAVYRNLRRLSIEAHAPAAALDTIPVRLWQLVAGTNYRFSVNSIDFNASVDGYLYDKLNNTKRLLNTADTTNVFFTATADTNSYMNRFYVVFSARALPVSNLIAKAYAKENGINVDWSTENEYNVATYEVEQSITNNNFKSAYTVKANNNISNNYSWFDASVNNGYNYYRIKMTNIDNSVKYSNILAVNLSIKGNALSVYPNPLKGENVNIQLNNLPKGNYTIVVYNPLGQNILQQVVKHDGGISTQNFKLAPSLSNGIYTISVSSEEGKTFTDKLIIKN